MAKNLLYYKCDRVANEEIWPENQAELETKSQPKAGPPWAENKNKIRDLMTPGESQLVSLADAAKALGTSRDYLNVLVHRGKLRAVKVAGNWVTTREWLAEYIAARLKGPSLPVSEETLQTIAALKEAFSQIMSPASPLIAYELYTARPVPYSLRPLPGGVHFIARNPLIRLPWPPEKIRLTKVSMTAATLLLLAGFALTHPGALTFPAQVGLEWGERAIETPKRIAALDLPVRTEGDLLLFSIPQPKVPWPLAFLYTDITSSVKTNFRKLTSLPTHKPAPSRLHWEEGEVAGEVMVLESLFSPASTQYDTFP